MARSRKGQESDNTATASFNHSYPRIRGNFLEKNIKTNFLRQAVGNAYSG